MILALSEAAQLALIQAIVVLLGAATAWFNLRSKMLELAATAKKDLAEVKSDVKVIEIATNSMKDALVEATKTAGLLEGADIERSRARQEHAAIAIDRREQSEAAEQPNAPGMSELHKEVKTTTETLVKRVDKAEDAIKKEIRK